MCGLLAVISKDQELIIDEQKALVFSRRLSHRGPDESGLVQLPHAFLSHERLSIVDLSTGKQPIESDSGAQLIHNGEIYNHAELRKTLKQKHTQRTQSDSEIILHLYEELGTQSIHLLDGVFAFVLVDGEKVFVGRDPIGVKPLYYGYDKQQNIWFASEIKAIQDVCLEISEFLPGHYYTHEEGFVRYYRPNWFESDRMPSQDASKLRDAFIEATKKRLMSDVPVGVLLSGGLDSSLVASIVAREMRKYGKTVKSFSVGLGSDSKDLAAARKVASFIGTEHHEIIFSVEEGIDLLKEIIQKLETYDVTTIRASTPMYIMSKYIRSREVKVVLSGEGADEIFGGYLYFHKAPSTLDFHQECVRRVKLLHTADVLRADRSTMGAGIEARVPFLDKNFLDIAMNIRPDLKQAIPGAKIEKHILRAAFDCPENPFLPEEILWRQKEQFSDGVGYSWVDGLKDYAETAVAQQEFEQRDKLYPYNTPTTKEAFLFRKIYSELFPHSSAEKLVHKWTPRWQEYDEDPSGRANQFHAATYHKQEEDSQPVAL